MGNKRFDRRAMWVRLAILLPAAIGLSWAPSTWLRWAAVFVFIAVGWGNTITDGTRHGKTIDRGMLIILAVGIALSFSLSHTLARFDILLTLAFLVGWLLRMIVWSINVGKELEADRLALQEILRDADGDGTR